MPKICVTYLCVRLAAKLIVFLPIRSVPCPISAELYERNCSTNTDGRTLSCYTCMGRDMNNCKHGLTCCSGSCFKLVDREHDMIVKGCTNGDEEDASMKIRTLDMQLYWVNNEKVTGQSFFCKGVDFCNTSPFPLLITSVAIVPLLRYLL